MMKRTSIDSDSTASDASFDDKELLSPSYRDDDDGQHANPSSRARFRDSEEMLGQMEEEEQVALMQADRRQIRSPRRSSSDRWLQRTWKQHKALLVILTSILSLPLFIALYAWLVSASRIPASIAAELVIPGPSGYVPDTKVSISSARKYAAASNDAQGHYGLKNAPGFAFNQVVPGWATPKEADRALGFPQGTTKKELAKQGWFGLRPKTMDVVFNGTLATNRGDLTWSAEDKDDGVFMRKDPGTSDIIFEDVTHARLQQSGQGTVAPGGGKSTLVRGQDVRDGTGRQLVWDSFVPSPDLSHVMFFSNTMPVYRWSKKSNVWIHNIKNKSTWPLGGGPSFPPSIAHAAWIPSSSSSLAFVKENDLYVAIDPDHSKPIRITNDGTTTIFNAVTDWVYEEEIFDSNHALWFSPGGTKLAYLRFDETEVPIYEFPVYNPKPTTAGATTPYLNSVRLKYPKPGFKNPTVSAHLVDLKQLASSLQSGSSGVAAAKFDLTSPTTLSDVAHEQTVDAALVAAEHAKDKLITEVVWLDDDSLYIRETDRGSDKMRGIVFDTSKLGQGGQMVGSVARRADATDKSWIMANQAIFALGAKDLTLKSSAYLDILEDERGFKHLAFFPNASSAQPTFLTTGAWEVAGLLHADLKRKKAYVSASYLLPYRRHILAVDLPTISQGGAALTSFKPNFRDITAANSEQSFAASFDPKGAYYLLQEVGPSLPTSRVIGIDDPAFEWLLEDNAVAAHTAAQFTKAHHVYYNVTLDDGITTTTVQEIRPYDFDASGETRYPVLLNVYGGPDSQQVSHSYKPSEWHESLVNELGYVVAIVDGRGTGYRGAAYRDGVAKHLGTVEIDDLLATASKIRKLPYVDEKRIGLWGWSYGGYFTNKALERDSGLLSLGMSVAPVTRWRFYDSIYTERYMKTWESNSKGYNESDVHVTDGFKHASYLLAQGSGDENVHFENSAHLLDLLTDRQVRGFWFRMFTDSAHRISTRGAYRELHEYMTDFLKTKWGAGGKRRFAGKGGRKGLVEEHVQRRWRRWLGRRDGQNEEGEEEEEEAVQEEAKRRREEEEEIEKRRVSRQARDIQVVRSRRSQSVKT